MVGDVMGPWLPAPTHDDWWWWATPTRRFVEPIRVFQDGAGFLCFPNPTGMGRDPAELGGLWTPCTCPPLPAVALPPPPPRPKAAHKKRRSDS